jgi:hypothetical protein
MEIQMRVMSYQGKVQVLKLVTQVS